MVQMNKLVPLWFRSTSLFPYGSDEQACSLMVQINKLVPYGSDEQACSLMVQMNKLVVGHEGSNILR